MSAFQTERLIDRVYVARWNHPGAVYIGRGMPSYGLIASPLANPYKIGIHGDRTTVLEHYYTWLSMMCRTDTPQRKELDRLTRLLVERETLTLGCWCSPEPCHGDVIKYFMDFVLIEGFCDGRGGGWYARTAGS